MEFDGILEQIEKLFELITTTPAAATLTAIGFILLVVGVVISVHILKSKPDETPAWLRIGLFACLIGGGAILRVRPCDFTTKLSKISYL